MIYSCRFKLAAEQLRGTGRKMSSCRLSDDSSRLPPSYYEPPQYYYTPPYITARPDVSPQYNYTRPDINPHYYLCYLPPDATSCPAVSPQYYYTPPYVMSQHKSSILLYACQHHVASQC